MTYTEAVAYARDLRAMGTGLKMIATLLNDEGYPTKTGRGKRHGKMVERIVNDEPPAESEPVEQESPAAPKVCFMWFPEWDDEEKGFKLELREVSEADYHAHQVAVLNWRSIGSARSRRP